MESWLLVAVRTYVASFGELFKSNWSNLGRIQSVRLNCVRSVHTLSA